MREGGNALKHGHRSCATILMFRRIRHALRLAAKNNERLRDHIRAARPKIRYKVWYERRVIGFQRTVSTHGVAFSAQRFFPCCLARLV
jgi:hypothetical protein